MVECDAKQKHENESLLSHNGCGFMGTDLKVRYCSQIGWKWKKKGKIWKKGWLQPKGPFRWRDSGAHDPVVCEGYCASPCKSDTEDIILELRTVWLILPDPRYYAVLSSDQSVIFLAEFKVLSSLGFSIKKEEDKENSVKIYWQGSGDCEICASWIQWEIVTLQSQRPRLVTSHGWSWVLWDVSLTKHKATNWMVVT